MKMFGIDAMGLLVPGALCVSLVMSTPTSAALITDNLVRHYKLDESAGATEAIDSTGNSNLSEDNDVNPGKLPAPGATGIINGAWDFDRANGEFLDEGDAIWGGTINVSASIWLNPASLTAAGSNAYTVFSEDSSSFANKDAVVQVSDDGAVTWTLEGIDSLTSADGLITNGVWSHLAVVRNGTDMRIYVNGSSVASKAISGTTTVDSVNDLMLGVAEDSDGQDPWDGLMDDAGFWERALSPGEVSAIYQQGLLGNDLTAVPEPSAFLMLCTVGLFVPSWCRCRKG